MKSVDWVLVAIDTPVTSIGLLMVFALRRAAKWDTSVGPRWMRNSSCGVTPTGPRSSPLGVVLTGAFALGIGVFVLLGAFG